MALLSTNLGPALETEVGAILTSSLGAELCPSPKIGLKSELRRVVSPEVV